MNRQKRSKNKIDPHLPEPETEQRYDADGYRLNRYYVRIGHEALEAPRVESKTTKHYCYLWSGRSTTLSEALSIARRQLPGLTNAPVYHAALMDINTCNNSAKRIDKTNGKKTLDETGIKPGDWFLIPTHNTLAVTAAVNKLSQSPHPKHELAPHKPLCHLAPPPIPSAVTKKSQSPNPKQELSLQQVPVETVTPLSPQWIDKPPVASLFTVKPTRDNKEEATPGRIRGLYISRNDIVDGIEDNTDSVGKYMESFLIAVRSRLALELAIEPKGSKQSVGSGCNQRRPVREAVEGVGERWLVELLKEEDWWIPKRRHGYVLRRLGSKAPLRPLFSAYARDVYCWYPFHRWKVFYG